MTRLGSSGDRRAEMNSQAQIPNGATVYDTTGDKLGTVRENNMEGGYLVVEKGWLFPKDFYVPVNTVMRVDEDGVILRVTKDELNDASYDQPPTMMAGQSTDYSAGQTTGYAAAPTDYTARQTTGATRDSATDATGDVRVPVREEELVVGKQATEGGRVHIHKDVVTEEATANVPLRQERVTVERVPASGEVQAGDDTFVERDIDVPVMGEEAVVGKRVSGVEEVVIRKDMVTKNEQVGDTVRKQRVTVDGVDTDDQATVDQRDRVSRST